VVLRYSQPRQDHYPEWTFTIPQMEKIADRIYKIIYIAMSDKAVFVPGESQCRWCPMSGNCTAQDDYLDKVMKAQFKSKEFEQPVYADAEALSTKKKDQIYRNLKHIRDWVKAFEANFSRELAVGDAKSEFKLVDGRLGKRQWKSEQRAKKLLAKKLGKDKVYQPRKLLSPNMAEELLPSKERIIFKNRLIKMDLVIQNLGKPTIVPKTDKRPAIKTTKEMFADFDDDDDSDTEEGEF